MHTYKFCLKVNGTRTEELVKAINSVEAKKIILARYPGAEIGSYKQID